MCLGYCSYLKMPFSMERMYNRVMALSNPPRRLKGFCDFFFVRNGLDLRAEFSAYRKKNTRGDA